MKVDRFPQYLNAPFQVLWLEADELAIFFGGFIFVLLYGGMFWFLMFLLPWGYSKLKKKYPRGFLKHCLYFAGLTRMHGYPCFFEDYFLE